MLCLCDPTTHVNTVLRVEEGVSSHWEKLATRLSLDQVTSNYLYSDLFRRLTQSHRKFYTLARVASMLELMDQVEDLAYCKEAVLLAIWYHCSGNQPSSFARQDIAYNQGASIRIMSTQLSAATISSQVLDQVEYLMGGPVHEGVHDVLSRDFYLFYDLMWAFFGAQKKQFCQHQLDFHEEQLFGARQGTRSLVENKLSFFWNFVKNGGFRTEYFKERFSRQAEENWKSLYDRQHFALPSRSTRSSFSKCHKVDQWHTIWGYRDP